MIDFSGSMGWGRDEVREVIRLLPASTIAGYTGYVGTMQNYHGDIRVIADKGKYDDNAIDRLHKHGNNNIDLDALKCLLNKMSHAFGYQTNKLLVSKQMEQM